MLCLHTNLTYNFVFALFRQQIMDLLTQFSKYLVECGTDEAGRGCLAGPVTAAAVILPENFQNNLLNDSKLVSKVNRSILKTIIENESVDFAFCHIAPQEIDCINILNASIKAMQISILNLNPHPEFIIVDGNKFKPINDIPYETIVKGDSKYLSIAAASIIAKTYRDEYMQRIHEEYPMYNWKQNKGYPTKEHREAIAKYGITKYHRKSFKLLPDQLKLNL